MQGPVAVVLWTRPPMVVTLAHDNILSVYRYCYWLKVHQSDFKTLIFLAHLCILHGGLICITFCPSVCHTFKNSYSESIIGRSLKLSQLWLTTLSEKFMSANGYGIIAVTGRTHCQRQVASFNCSNHFKVFYRNTHCYNDYILHEPVLTSVLWYYTYILFCITIYP